MSSNLGGHDPVTFIHSLEGPGTQEPQWPATIDVKGIDFEGDVRRRDRTGRISLAPMPAALRTDIQE